MATTHANLLKTHYYIWNYAKLYIHIISSTVKSIDLGILSLYYQTFKKLI